MNGIRDMKIRELISDFLFSSFVVGFWVIVVGSKLINTRMINIVK